MKATHRLLRPFLAGLLVSLALLGACRDSPVSPAPELVFATLRVSANVSGTLVTAVVVTVTAPDISSPLVFNLEIQNGVAGGTLRVPTGPARTFAASAFAASGDITHEGSATADVRRGENPPLNFMLQPTSGEVPIVITLARYSVEVSPAEVNLRVSDTVALNAVIRDAEGNVVQGEVVWGSPNPALATVSSTGVVVARQAGEVQIVASYAGVTGRARITVVERNRDQLAFVSDRDCSPGTYCSEIYLMDADGLDVQRLTHHPGVDDRPKWSADGTQIMFMSNRGATFLPIHVMDADGSNVRYLSIVGYNPDWSPDGRRIAFTSFDVLGREICTADLDGTNLQRLTHHPELDTDPSWSPDGSKIVFMSLRDWNEEIYAMDADGSNLQRLTNHPGYDGQPHWSPDGRQIVFTSHRNGNREIFVMNADGSNLRNLTNHPASDVNPSWSPDGSKIAFSSNRDGNAEIYVMNADGSNVRRVTNHPGSDRWPVWRPGGNRGP